MIRQTLVGVVLQAALFSGFVGADEDLIQLEVAPAVGKPSRPTKTEAEAKKDEPAAIEPDRSTAAPLSPKFLRLHLQDGTLLAGELSVKEITVDTDFGKLTVPIEKIRTFTPGLESGERLKELQAKISALGADDYKTREEAQKELSKQGPSIRRELERRMSDDNAEIKRRLGEILKELDERAEEQDEEDEGAPAAPQTLIRQDTVSTTEFTVVGKISPPEFTIQSKYGALQVKLSDIRSADRPFESKESLKRNLSVNNIAQRSFKSSGIRVQAGDKISVKADGTMVMTPWGSNSVCSPDGAANYGWYIPNEIPGGALVAKIGDKGQAMKIGKSATFTAKSSGVLQFAVGIQADYAGENYQFPGEYKLKIKVDPK